MTSIFSILTVDALVISAAGFILVCVGMQPLIRFLTKNGMIAQPNERSNHTVPKPEGGGLLVLAVLIPAWYFLADRPMGHLLIPALVLAVISWIDDTRGLAPTIRFPAHILAVAVALWFEPTFIFPLQKFVPEPVAYFLIAFIWVWFINLFNFMDGIDGIAGTETASIGLGVALVVTLHGFAADFGELGVCTAVIICGFLIWNWQPAKVFLGDVGSVPIGFLLGWLLLSLAAAGPWVVAIILPAYYLADSTLTLLHRLVRREKVWQAHREHFYQRAAVTGVSHSRVVIYVITCNVFLILISLYYDVFGVFGSWALATLPVLALLFQLHRLGRKSDAFPKR